MLTAKKAREILEDRIREQYTKECESIEKEINIAVNELQNYVNICPVPKECTIQSLNDLGYKTVIFESGMNETSLKIKW